MTTRKSTGLGLSAKELVSADTDLLTALFERYARSEKALVAALAEMYVQGVSTRKVRAITEELCGHSFSASAISSINKSLDETLARFATRALEEAYPYLRVV